MAYSNAKAAGLIAELITDEGRTEFRDEPTATCCAIGPDWSHLVDLVTESLELY